LQGLDREELCQAGEDELPRNGLDLADSLQEPSTVDSAELVEGDLTVSDGASSSRTSSPRSALRRKRVVPAIARWTGGTDGDLVGLRFDLNPHS
jgi:hypothetical protein